MKLLSINPYLAVLIGSLSTSSTAQFAKINSVVLVTINANYLLGFVAVILISLAIIWSVGVILFIVGTTKKRHKTFLSKNH